jgi:hypothetical protein
MAEDNIVHLNLRAIESLRTSKEWLTIFKYNILDPDGWDRSNYEYSFNEEKISYPEFMQRVFRSTLGDVNKTSHDPYYDISHVASNDFMDVDYHGNKIYEIEHIRARNNSLWMNLLKIALKYAPKEAKEVLKQINENDTAVSKLLKELVDE